jgi:hypothetical protein
LEGREKVIKGIMERKTGEGLRVLRRENNDPLFNFRILEEVSHK